MMTSRPVSVARCRTASRRMSMASIWFEITGALVSSGAIEQREAHVHDDEHVHAHRRAMSMGRFSDNPPSTSSRPSRSTGENTPGRGNAGAQGAREVAGAHHYRFTGLQIRGHRTKWRGQLVEVRDARHRQRQRAQRLVELLALDQPFGQQEVAAAQAERKLHEEVLVLLLATERQLRARRAVAEGVLPVERAHDALDVLSGKAAWRTSPPTTAPMLVPAIASIGMRISSSTFSTPMCAAPRAPPPESTRPMRGRADRGVEPDEFGGAGGLPHPLVAPAPGARLRLRDLPARGRATARERAARAAAGAVPARPSRPRRVAPRLGKQPREELRRPLAGVPRPFFHGRKNSSIGRAHRRFRTVSHVCYGARDRGHSARDDG